MSIKRRIISVTGARNVIVRTDYLVAEDYRIDYDSRSRKRVITLFEGLRDPQREGLLEQAVEKIIEEMKVKLSKL